jgi:hypothetical protein
VCATHPWLLWKLDPSSPDSSVGHKAAGTRSSGRLLLPLDFRDLHRLYRKERHYDSPLKYLYLLPVQVERRMACVGRGIYSYMGEARSILFMEPVSYMGMNARLIHSAMSLIIPDIASDHDRFRDMQQPSILAVCKYAS